MRNKARQTLDNYTYVFHVVTLQKEKAIRQSKLKISYWKFKNSILNFFFLDWKDYDS